MVCGLWADSATAEGEIRLWPLWPERMRWIHLLLVWREAWAAQTRESRERRRLVVPSLGTWPPNEICCICNKVQTAGMEIGRRRVGCVWVNINESVSSPLFPQGLILDDVPKSRPPAMRPRFITLNRFLCVCEKRVRVSVCTLPHSFYSLPTVCSLNCVEF